MSQVSDISSQILRNQEPVAKRARSTPRIKSEKAVEWKKLLQRVVRGKTTTTKEVHVLLSGHRNFDRLAQLVHLDRISSRSATFSVSCKTWMKATRSNGTWYRCVLVPRAISDWAVRAETHTAHRPVADAGRLFKLAREDASAWV